MGDVTVNARVSLPRRRVPPALIRHAKNNISSNNALVNAPTSVQFLRRYRRGYDRDHRVVL
jgi:hypothetical protein